MYKYSRTIFLALVFSLLAGSWHPVSAQTNAAEARKFDEFGDAQYSDIAARLDNFAVSLQQESQASGFLIAYRSRRDLPGLSSRLVNWMKNYLINIRGLSADRIHAIDGGVAACVTQELWIVPPGAAPRPRPDAYARQFENTDAPRKFDEGPYYTPADYPESYAGDVGHSLEGFSEALRKQPKSLGYLIGYAGYRTDEWEQVSKKGVTRTHRRVTLDPPTTAWKELIANQTALVKTYRIPGSRIRLVNGGYRSWRSVELWIVPRGQRAPVPTPNAFPKEHK